MLKIISFLLIILFAAIGAYFINGGWAQNIGELYRNYKDSKMTLKTFIKSIIKNIH